MTEEGKKQLEHLETSLHHLVYLHDELRRENADLREQLRQREAESQRQADDYRALQVDYARLKTAMAINLKGSDVRETKQRLSRLVREVDKCITLLNG